MVTKNKHTQCFLCNKLRFCQFLVKPGVGYTLCSMLYVFYGTDTEGIATNANEVVRLFQSKESGVMLTTFEDDCFNEPQFEDIVSGGQSLFGTRCVVFFRRVFDNQKAKEIILSRLGEMVKAEHVFIFSEKKLDAPTIMLFKKAGATMKECSKKEKNTTEKSFVSFALADAFGKRDKKNMWAVFHKEIMNGSTPEGLHGILFWQIKNMLLAGGHSETECARTGMKPFVFSKARVAAKNFSQDELRLLSARIVSLYHHAHEGVDLETATEQFILSI